MSNKRPVITFKSSLRFHFLPVNRASTVELCHAAAVHTAVHAAVHGVATVIGGHCMIAESMSDGNRTVPIKVVNAAANHQGRSPRDQR